MSPTNPVPLSKSRITIALQCPKRLHFKLHRPELEVISKQAEAAFETGNQIGELVRTIYATPGSVSIDDNYDDLEKALERTADLLRAGHREPIFEATFRHDNVLVRVDALVPHGDGWRIVEVKSSTTLKDEHLPDCTVQTWACVEQGLNVTAVALAHVDNTFIYDGNSDYRGLLIEEDVTQVVMDALKDVPHWAEGAREAASSTMPAVDVGPQCDKPYPCSFFAQCWPVDARYPIHGLAGTKKNHFELIKAGYRDITEVPADLLTFAGHRRIHAVTVSGQPEILPGAREFTAGLGYPRYYLDFETVAPAIPIWPDTRPYQQLPFQFSLHVERKPGQLEHLAFLDLSGEPPMRALAERLVTALETQGPILMYTGVERHMINVLTRLHPDLAPQFEPILARLVDMKPPIKDNYYHPDMLGSWSIKDILPTIAPELSYDDLGEVQEGTGASRAYLEAIHPETTETRREDLRVKMLNYCRVDTEAMVRLVHFFERGGETTPDLTSADRP